MNAAPAREFTHLEGFALFLGLIGIQLSSEVIASWGNYFYSPPTGGLRTVYVSVGIVGFIFVFGRIFDFITDPLIGLWSDQTKAKPGRGRIIPIYGRRRPFIFWGSVLLVFTSIAFWYPPVADTSWVNFFYGLVLVSLHWGFFTLCFIGLYALGPEIARSEQARERLGTWFGGGLLVGLFFAALAPGVLIEALDPAPLAEGVSSAAGYQRTAMVLAFTSLILFQVPVWVIRERNIDEHVQRPRTGRKELREALRNRPLWIYFGAYFFLSLGQLALQRVLPYWVEIGLGGSEQTVSIIMLPYILTAAIGIAAGRLLSKRLHLKWLMFISWVLTISAFPFIYVLGVIDLPSETKIALAAAIFAWSGLGQGLFYFLIVPLIGEIIDYDARRSGERREALYNGIHGFSIKSAQTLSILVANASMAWWGNSVAEPWGIYAVGPIATACGIIALVFVWFYPILHVTPETTAELEIG